MTDFGIVKDSSCSLLLLKCSFKFEYILKDLAMSPTRSQKKKAPKPAPHDP